jgi:hypothetical protein
MNLTTSRRARLFPAILLVVVGGCGGSGDETAPATTGPATISSAPAAESFAVAMPRTGDYGLHDGLVSFVPEEDKTRVVMDFAVYPDDLPAGGLPATIRHGSCTELGEVAYRLDRSTVLTQTVLDVPAAEVRDGFYEGSLAVTVERSPSNHLVVACGDTVTG